MVGSVLTLSLLGLGAVTHALPASKTVEERQGGIWGIGSGSGSFGYGSGSLPTSTCLSNVPISEQPPCILAPITGGFNPPKEKRQGSRFSLPPDSYSNTQHAIEELELELEQLQNKQDKTPDDYDEIRAIKSALKYLAGITSVSAPPGSGSTFTPGKRFSLPPDSYSNTKHAIEELEVESEQLQNKDDKTPDDYDEIRAIKSALKYLAGITSISAPPGSGSTFTPGKRQTFGLGDGVGSYSSECPNLDGAELALEALMHEDDHPSVEEYIVTQKLRHFLNGCGVTIIKSPDGTTTTIKPSDKRDTSPAPAPVFAIPTQSPGFDLAGLEKAYESLLQSVGTTKPSFSTWLAMQHLADLLEVYGISIDRSPVGKRAPQSSGTITIGTKACQLSDIMGLRAALAALQTAYGDPAKAPSNIFLIEQVIVTALQICGQGVSGWTTLTPGNPIPGQPINPDPTTPGAPIKPSNKIRQAPVSDPAALLAALNLLEQKYGTYGSGTIPVPIFLIMESMVTVLQDIPGVSVPGWPVLGQGSVTLTPST
ncbi:hypothetical protein QBC46DRAFT_282302 [Diplogelasinospora grovesii]|uniref:Uncharacterized protein n=1 Tax=Diplogelasinospora grovesii TaxID=303347 RepID=A0AAN6NFM7_9PEZI|nr:hypothetical protein QBC46DRAFT_282302 [Diplogelasinospora grovesii]